MTIVVPLLGLLGAMKEWGFVLRLHLTPPRLLNVQLDCFHDLAEVAFRALTYPEYREYAPLAAGIILAIMAILFYLLIRYRRQIWHGLQQLPWQFIVATGVLLALAALIEFRGIRIKTRDFWEEMIELQAAITLLFAALICRIAPDAHWRKNKTAAPLDADR